MISTIIVILLVFGYVTLLGSASPAKFGFAACLYLHGISFVGKGFISLSGANLFPGSDQRGDLPHRDNKKQ